MNLEALLASVFAGTGSFGRVMAVREKESGIYYALKILVIEDVIRLKQVEHVKNEKEILEQVNHPFVVNLWVLNLWLDIGWFSDGSWEAVLVEDNIRVLYVIRIYLYWDGLPVEFSVTFSCNQIIEKWISFGEFLILIFMYSKSY